MDQNVPDLREPDEDKVRGGAVADGAPEVEAVAVHEGGGEKHGDEQEKPHGAHRRRRRRRRRREPTPLTTTTTTTTHLHLHL